MDPSMVARRTPAFFSLRLLVSWNSLKHTFTHWWSCTRRTHLLFLFVSSMLISIPMRRTSSICRYSGIPSSHALLFIPPSLSRCMVRESCVFFFFFCGVDYCLLSSAPSGNGFILCRCHLEKPHILFYLGVQGRFMGGFMKILLIFIWEVHYSVFVCVCACVSLWIGLAGLP